MKTCLVFQFLILFSESKEEAEKMEKEITEIEWLILEIEEKIMRKAKRLTPARSKNLT